MREIMTALPNKWKSSTCLLKSYPYKKLVVNFFAIRKIAVNTFCLFNAFAHKCEICGAKKKPHTYIRFRLRISLEKLKLLHKEMMCVCVT